MGLRAARVVMRFQAAVKLAGDVADHVPISASCVVGGLRAVSEAALSGDVDARFR